MLRQRAEACLVDLRARNRDEVVGATTASPRAARELSNLPSGAAGRRARLACRRRLRAGIRPRGLRPGSVGVLPRLVRAAALGLHVVEVLAREAGIAPEFAEVRAAVAQSLRPAGVRNALRQYLRLLAGRAPTSKA